MRTEIDKHIAEILRDPDFHHGELKFINFAAPAYIDNNIIDDLDNPQLQMPNAKRKKSRLWYFLTRNKPGL